VLAFITSRLDYCNSVLGGVPQTTLEPLERRAWSQRPEWRSAADLWIGTAWAFHSRAPPPALVACTLAHSIQMMCSDALDTHGEMPTLAERHVGTVILLQQLVASRSDLRSSTTYTYVTPRLCTTFEERAFSHAGSWFCTAWNSLPVNIRAETSQVKFKSLLKTHYFNLAFSSLPSWCKWGENTPPPEHALFVV